MEDRNSNNDRRSTRFEQVPLDTIMTPAPKQDTAAVCEDPAVKTELDSVPANRLTKRVR